MNHAQLAKHVPGTEARLLEQNQWFAATLKSIGDAVITTDNEGKITFMNPVAETLTGWTLTEAIGKDIVFKTSDEGPSADLPPLSEHDALLNEIVIHINDDTFLMAKDGATIPIEYNGAPIKDDQGHITGVVLILHNITDRKRAEEALRKARDELEQRVQERTAELLDANNQLWEVVYERKRVEEALLESERFLNGILDTIQDGIVVKDRDYRIRRVNRWMEEQYAADMPLVGKACCQVFHHQDVPCAQCPAVGTLQNGAPHREIIPYPSEKNPTRWLDFSTFPLRDADNQIIGIIEHIKDITEQKKAERILQHERQRLFDLLENLPVYVYLQSPDYSIRFANRRFRERFGDPTSKQYYKLMWGRGELWEENPAFQVFRTNKPYEWEWNHYPTGKIYHVYDYPFTDSDGSPLVLELGIDITERKNMQVALEEERSLLAQKVEERTAALSNMNQQLQKEIEEREQIQIELRKAKDAAESASRAKSEFLANMSHELRTPLNAILGYAQILKTGDNLSERQVEGLQTIKNSGQHLLNLINDILDLSKIEAGRMEPDLREFHLPEFLIRIAEMIRFRAEQNGIAFEFLPDPALPQGVRADEKKLRQVLLNLLGNAVKFTEEGTITFRVRLREGEMGRGGERESGGWEDREASPALSPNLLLSESPHLPISPSPHLIFEVEDTGIGIPADKLDDIFLPFQQVGDARYSVEGTGLGLAISRKLVKIMGGELSVKSTVGQGSRFWFELALPEVAGVSPMAMSSARKIIGYKGAQRTILIADDRRENRGVLLNMLLPIGFKIIEAENGQECLQKALARHPDAILLDLRMPVMDGFETARHLRQAEPLQDVVIIAVSASVYQEIQTRSLEAGCDLFLKKPIQLETLLDILQTHLQLEWIFEEELALKTPAAVQARTKIDVSVAIPEDQLLVLTELASKGRVKKFLAALADLETAHQDYQPFIDELRGFVKKFQFKEVLKRLEKVEVLK